MSIYTPQQAKFPGPPPPVNFAPALHEQADEPEFRHGLCSCFDVCCSGLWWNTCCWHFIPLTQLANRLKLSACGTRAAGDTKASTFAIVTVLVVILFVAEFAFLGLYKNGNRAAVLFFLVWLGLIIWFIVLMARVRVTFRRHYKIPGDCCEDCCCMFWCSWCNTIRMLRQTHDEDEYPYQCCTLDGLPSKAPELV